MAFSLASHLFLQSSYDDWNALRSSGRMGGSTPVPDRRVPMVPSVTTVLDRFKTDWAAQLHPEAIRAACEAAGYTAWRDRLLNPVVTVQLFLLQILHGNTACRHLPHLS